MHLPAPTLTVAPAELPAGGRGYRLLAEMVIPRPIDGVFAFFSNTDNLGQITPSWVNFRVLKPDGVHPVPMQDGTLINYRISLHGVPMRWRSQITAWEPPNRFVDEQRKGPYRVWVHEHRFRPFGESGEATHMTDEVFYSHIGGRLVHELFVKRDLVKIFRYRQQRLAELLAKMA